MDSIENLLHHAHGADTEDTISAIGHLILAMLAAAEALSELENRMTAAETVTLAIAKETWTK